MGRFLYVNILLTAFLVGLLVATSQDSSVFGQTVDFAFDVRPILSDRCFHCHGPDADNQDSDYRMDTEESLLANIVKGDIDESELYQRIINDDPELLMPPPKSNRSLSEREKDIIKRWIEQGAPYSGHWAFEPPRRPEIPSLESAVEAGWDKSMIQAWSANPIDAFIARRLVREGLQPSPQADLQTRVRRAALTTSGLLPPEKIVPDQDAAEDHYERAVETLLDSTDYAERQTLRWLDAARYADTDGYQNDYGRENWPWRDWVLKAFDENMPFDQFVVEQIAGDMLPDASTSQRLASAFNRNHRQNAEGGALAEEFAVENVIDRVETTSTVFLGLTFGCARCHDHKYDPLPQKEFFQMYAYFNNIGERGIGKGVDANPTMVVGSPLKDLDPKWLQDVVDSEAALAASKRDFEKKRNAWIKQTQDLVSRVEDVKSEQAKNTIQESAEGEESAADSESSAANRNALIKDEDRKIYDSLPEDIVKILRKKKHSGGEKKKLDGYFASITPEQKALRSAVKSARREYTKRGGKLATVMVMNERTGKPAPTYVLDRGQYQSPLKDTPLSRAVPSVLLPDDAKQPGNRLELAQWLVSEQNPLTARVIVNRIWRDHFGIGLVKTVDDFGIQGEAPSHPELLDWLAQQFVSSNWDVKGMHRLILTSQAFQQSSKMTAETREADPENRLLARGPRYRADGFTIRDIALQSAGLLNSELGGPPVKPYQPKGLWNVVAAGPGSRYVEDKGGKLYRKSMYSYWKRAVNPPRQTIFDAGGREVCSVQINRTNTPLQALVMLNDKTFVEAARSLAQEVLQQNLKSDEQKIEIMYLRAIGRNAKPSVKKVLFKGLATFREHFSAVPKEAKQLLSVGASKADPALDTQEHAAMTMVAHMIMNLDEFLTVE